jgi:membrane-associated phospholipid phosphatase
MKYTIWLLMFFFIGISTIASAQVIVKDTTSKKDTTIGKKLEKLGQTIVKDTTLHKESKKDTILEKKLEKRYYSFHQFEHETILFVETPGRWRSRDWLRLGIVIGATAAIMTLDQPIMTATQSPPQHYYYSVPVVGGRLYGEWYTIGTLTAMFAGYGILAKDTAAKKIAIELFQAGVYAELVTEITKVGIGRARPYKNEGPFTYRPFTFINTAFQSSPSGHATAAMALSTVMFRHSHSTVLKILSFVPAAFTLYSRVYQNYHWASDEFLGSAVGFATGNWVVNLHEKRRHKINIPAAK